MKKHPPPARRRPITNRLWRFRKRKGFTQKQVAQILGYASPTHLSHWERGRTLPSLISALKLSAVYDAPLEILFHDIFQQLRAELRATEQRLRQERARHEGETALA